MKIVKLSLHDEAVARIRDMVLNGELAPGSHIPEKELCAAFGISRTPLREALKVLAREGFIQLLPNRGARVVEVTEKDMAEMFEVMAVLEGLAGEQACERIDYEALAGIKALHEDMVGCYQRRDLANYFAANQKIHESIVDAADNRLLGQLYEGLRLRMRPVRYKANLSAKRWREAVEEHEEILAALAGRDGERLGRLLREHLLHKLESLNAEQSSERQRG